MGVGYISIEFFLKIFFKNNLLVYLQIKKIEYLEFVSKVLGE